MRSTGGPVEPYPHPRTYPVDDPGRVDVLQGETEVRFPP